MINVRTVLNGFRTKTRRHPAKDEPVVESPKRPTVTASVLDGIRLLDVLQDRAPEPLTLTAFKEFCRSMMTLESIEFWLHVERLRSLPDATAAVMEYEYVYYTYIQRNAPHEVNVSARDANIALRRLQKCIKQNRIDKTIFDDCQNSVQELLSRDVFMRFKQRFSPESRSATNDNTAIRKP
ncbi:RGS domain-containing protein [Plasmodiophora brassicae]|uniref:RGS domain-containing protein n=1 Tax=Plasmodiophora brassicae TaxID=37360 RepID=A0A0G4ITG5_PLABS|nr:hypothetical protein PBRA_006674 [Plasmodiophora brassicae]SPQ95812.1 unnamed protein product [Plasmodiophora brassicae]